MKTKVDDIVNYYHGRDDNSFHGDERAHRAVIYSIDEDRVAEIHILGMVDVEEAHPETGEINVVQKERGTIPVSGVRCHADPQRQVYAAFWEPKDVEIADPFPSEPVVVVEEAAEVIAPVESVEPMKKKSK